MRGFVERNIAKTMTCRSQMANAVRELPTQPGRSMGVIQSCIVGYFASVCVCVPTHARTGFRGPPGDQIHHVCHVHQPGRRPDLWAPPRLPGNWSTQQSHSSGNMMAAAVAVKTGIIRPPLPTRPKTMHGRGLPFFLCVASSSFGGERESVQQMTSMNHISIQSHIRRVCTPLDRVGRGSRPRQLRLSRIRSGFRPHFFTNGMRETGM